MCRTTLAACLVALLPPLAAIPPPCTEEELLQSSDIAVEAYVVEVACGEERDSGECTAETADFLPELVSDSSPPSR